MGLSTSTEPVVQRDVVFRPPVFTHTRNLAHAWKGGGDYAVTPSIINGKEIPPTTNKQGLINAPQFHFRDVGVPGAADRFQLHMGVPTQEVGYRMDLPNDGPWTLPDVRVEEIDAFIGIDGLQTPPRTEEEQNLTCTLQILPDGDLKGKIRAHEMHHANEQAQAVNEILVPWDQELQDAQPLANQLRNRGPLELLKSFDAIGPDRSAQDVADALVHRLKELGDAYHSTEEGRPPKITRFQLDKKAKIYRVWLRLDKV